MIKETKKMMYELTTVWVYVVIGILVLSVTAISIPFVALHRLTKSIYKGVTDERETEDGNDQRSKARRACCWIYRRIMGRKVS